MSFLQRLQHVVKRWIARKRVSDWDGEFALHLKTHPDPYNASGLELAQRILQRIPIAALSVSQRRELLVQTHSANVEEFLSVLTVMNRLVEAQDSIPNELFTTTTDTVKRLDDYFVSKQGHMVLTDKIASVVIGRIEQLVTTLHQSAVDYPERAGYYQRKLYPLFRDSYRVMQVLYISSCR